MFGVLPRPVRACLPAALALSIALPAAPQTRPQTPAQHARVQFQANAAAIWRGHQLLLGTEFALDPGWHIYWINPGDSGEPPKIQWHLPSGLRAGETIWPTPQRLAHGSIVDYGYERGVMLLTPIEASKNLPVGGRENISAHVTYLVCREICIPGKADLSLSLPVSRVSRDSNPERWNDALAQAPRPAPPSWKTSAASEKDVFALSVHNGKRARDVQFFPLDPDVIENSAPQRLKPLPDGFRLRLEKSRLLTKPPARLRGLMEIDGGRAVEISAPVR